MAVLDSLPDRPLTDAELASLNRSESIDLAVDVTEEEGRTDDIAGLLFATDDWVKGLAYADDGWVVVETVTLDETARFDALQTCEDAVRARLHDRD